MAYRKRNPVTREDVLCVMRRLVKEHGEKVTIHDVRRELSIHSRIVDEYFGSWAKLRKLVGLKLRRAPVDKVYSDEELLSEFRRISIERGYPPSATEYQRLTGHRWKTLMLRFGSRENLHRRVRILDEYVRTFGTEELPAGKGQLAFDEAVLRKSWDHVKIGFALYASDIRDGDIPGPEGGGEYGLLIVGVNDWPRAPMPVLRISDLLPNEVAVKLFSGQRE